MSKEGIFRVSLFGKYCLGFSFSAKVFFGVAQKYPTPLIPVCRNAKFTGPLGAYLADSANQCYLRHVSFFFGKCLYVVVAMQNLRLMDAAVRLE